MFCGFWHVFLRFIPIARENLYIKHAGVSQVDAPYAGARAKAPVPRTKDFMDQLVGILMDFTKEEHGFVDVNINDI